MSFSSDVKKEVCASAFECDECLKAEIYGFILCIKDESVLLHTESNSSAEIVFEFGFHCDAFGVD